MHPIRWPAERVRFTAASLALGILITLPAIAESTDGSSSPSGAALLATIVSSHATLRSYAATIKADFKEHSFPFVRLGIDGSAYYRAPDQYAVVFRNAPSYMKGFAQGYAIMMDTGSWHRYFSVAAMPDRTSGGRLEHVLRLTGLDPKGFLHHGDIFIDAATNDITEMNWLMSNGMTFFIQQTYEQMPSGFHVVKEQHATFHVPFAHGTATMTLADYHCNVAISDEVFEIAEQASR